MIRLLILLLLMVQIFSCGKQEDRLLRVLLHSPVITLDPQTTDDFATLSALSNVYESLVTYSDDLKLVPLLAISWNNPDEKTWRFELRKNVFFHDGQPFTARDVKYTLDRGITATGSFVKAEMPDFDSATVIGDHTVEIITKNPFPLLLSKMSHILIIKEGSGTYVQKRTNGTGPYQVKEWNPEKQLTLQPFEKYWKTNPYWQKAVVTWQSDPVARLKAVERGDADITDVPPIEESLKQRNAAIIQHPSDSVMFLGFAVKSGGDNPFSDASVRKAIALAIDQRALIREALKGFAQPASQLAPPDVFGYVSDLPLPRPDLNSAKSLLKQSKFAVGFEQPLYYSSTYSPVAQFVAGAVQELGIRLVLRQVDMRKMDELLFGQSAPAYILQFTFPAMDTSDLLYFGFHTMTEDRTYGVLNFSGFSDPDLDRLLEASGTEMDAARRFALLADGM
ncbi:MAG TPA: ABC transporter substrate-binding protein, partial [Acidobacteriota bacterium]|nr:ABC transporter substrate-binding protein [Acidobacteriota bacterium]